MLASVAAMARKMKEQPEVMAIMIAVLCIYDSGGCQYQSSDRHADYYTALSDGRRKKEDSGRRDEN